MVSLSRYWSSQFSEEGETTTPEVTKEGETSTPEVTKVGDKRRSKDTENNEAKKGKPAAKKKAEGKIDGLSLTQHRRMLGDQVVLAEVRNMDQAATILGSANKLRKGTRFVHKDGSSSSWEVSTMDIVFMPKKKELRIWWTMGSGH
eukprot:GFUD01121961.1.p1 GENE.GFUD01121961.1~~GFUD01121961.1.p1  ORF type:complete len:163 (-),score=60.16 GFUD01121961.1:149-586(-)